ncbi:MAG: hypothetical protein ACTSPY_03695 [Candidatus Helarchaeota archaeon]
MNPTLLTNMIIIMTQLTEELMTKFPLKRLGIFNAEKSEGYIIDIEPLEILDNEQYFVLGVRNVELSGTEWIVPSNSIYLKDIGLSFLDYYKQKCDKWCGEDGFFNEIKNKREFKKLLEIISRPSLGILNQYGGGDLIVVNAIIDINSEKLFNSGLITDINSKVLFGNIENAKLLPSNFFLDNPYDDELKTLDNINTNVIFHFSNLIESVNHLSNEIIFNTDNIESKNDFLLLLFESEEFGTYLYAEYFKSESKKLGIFIKLYNPIDWSKKYPMYYLSEAVINATKKGFNLLVKWMETDDINLFLEKPDYIYSLLIGKITSWLSKIRFYKEVRKEDERLEIIRNIWDKKEKFKIDNREGEIKIIHQPTKRLKQDNPRGIDDYGWGFDSRYIEYLNKKSRERWVKKNKRWVRVNNTTD